MFRGIKARLILYVGMTLLVLFSVAAVINLYIQEQALSNVLAGSTQVLETIADEQVKSNREAVAVKATGMAKMLAAMAPDAVVNLALSNLLTFAQVAASDPDIAYVRFVNAADAQLASAGQNTRADGTAEAVIDYQGEKLGRVVVGYSYLRAEAQNAKAKEASAKRMVALRANADASLGKAAISQLVLMVVIIATAAVLVYFIALGITRALKTMVTAMAEIAQGSGDLTRRINISGRDEVAQLAGAFNRFVATLESLVRTVKNTALAVAGTTQVIADGNSKLAERTQEQASSLEETAASIEEIAGTVKQNAENSRIANELAALALSQAREGREIATQAISAIDEIRASSARIAGVVEAVDSIVFQSNLLSHNAAIEAAHAGAYGRGFGVVAGEMKVLANRVAEASTQIKTLIAASAAKVEAGTKLTSACGNSLDTIVENALKITEVFKDVAAASVEQSNGIGQINNVIAEMDRITQHNLQLVEETSEASATLSQQAGELAVRVDEFRVSEEPDSGESLALEVPAVRLKLASVQ